MAEKVEFELLINSAFQKPDDLSSRVTLLNAAYSMQINRQSINKLISICLSLAFALLICEVILRVVNYHPQTLTPGMFIPDESPILPYKLKPNFVGYYVGSAVTIDADGNRIVSPDRTLLTPNDSQGTSSDILVLGDSVVFGHGLSNEATIASQLQNAIWRGGSNSAVKNIGVPGYSSWNEYAALAAYLQAHTVETVILVYVPNDVTFDNDHFKISKGEFADISNTRFQRLTQFMYSHVYSTYLVKSSLQALIFRLRRNRNPPTDVNIATYMDAAALDYSMQALTNIQNMCSEKHIRFYVGIYRDLWHFLDPQTSLRYEEMVKESLDKRGIKSFLIKSHIDNLNINEARVFWNDAHPSAKAVSFIVKDILKGIEVESGQLAPRFHLLFPIHWRGLSDLHFRVSTHQGTKA